MEFIPHIVYINLDKRPDRKTEIEGELARMGLSAERIKALDTTPRGYIGCTATHLHALKMARERGWGNVTLLEDDFQFIVDKETLEKNLREFFSRNIEYDVLMLSYNLHGGTPYDSLVGRVVTAQTTSGYIVHSRYYDTIINHLEKGLDLLVKTNDHGKYTIDQYWKSLQREHVWYYFMERIGVQREGFSNIEGHVVNYKM